MFATRVSQRRRPIRAIPAALILILALGCTDSGTDDASLSGVRFLTNDSSLVGYVGGGFNANLLFTTPGSNNPGEIEKVRLLPDTAGVAVDDFNVSENTAGDGVRRWALSLDLRGEQTGVHEFREVSLTAGGETVRVPLGRISIDIRDGTHGDVFVLMASGGVHSEPMPYEFDVENTSGAPVTIVDVALEHPRVDFDRADVLVNDEPLPDPGASLEPGQTVRVRVEWTVDWPPPAPLDLELRGLLSVDQVGGRRWGALHNMVFRADPALDDLGQDGAP